LDLWPFAQPLIFALMLALVWGGLPKIANYWEFALYVFTGQVVFEMFSTAVDVGQDFPYERWRVSEASAHSVLCVSSPHRPDQHRHIFVCNIRSFCLRWGDGAFPQLGLQLLLVPAFVAIYILFLVPIVMLMSVVGLQFRDGKHISQLVVQGLFLMSPVMMPREVFAQPI